MVLQPAGIALKVLEAACAAAACAVSGTRLSSRRVDEVQRLKVGFVSVSAGKSAGRMAFGGQFDDIAKAVLGRNVMERTHECHSVGVLTGMACQVRLDLEGGITLRTDVSGLLAIFVLLRLNLDLLDIDLGEIRVSAFSGGRHRCHRRQLDVAGRKVGGHGTVLDEKLVHEQNQQLAGAGHGGVCDWRSSKVLESLGRLVEADHVKRKMGFGWVKFLREAQHGSLVGRGDRSSQRQIKHGEVEPPWSQLVEIHREVELRLFSGSEVIVKKLNLVVAQGKLKIVRSTGVGGQAAGVPDPVDLGPQNRWEEGRTKKVFLEKGSEGKRKGRAVA